MCENTFALEEPALENMGAANRRGDAIMGHAANRDVQRRTARHSQTVRRARRVPFQQRLTGPRSMRSQPQAVARAAERDRPKGQAGIRNLAGPICAATIANTHVTSNHALVTSQHQSRTITEVSNLLWKASDIRADASAEAAVTPNARRLQLATPSDRPVKELWRAPRRESVGWVEMRQATMSGASEDE